MIRLAILRDCQRIYHSSHIQAAYFLSPIEVGIVFVRDVKQHAVCFFGSGEVLHTCVLRTTVIVTDGIANQICAPKPYFTIRYQLLRMRGSHGGDQG